MAVKHCVVCGSEFIDYGRGKYCQGPHYKHCIVCGNEFEYDVRAQKIPKTCSRSCASRLARTNYQYKSKRCDHCHNLYIPTSGSQKLCKNCQNLK